MPRSRQSASARPFASLAGLLPIPLLLCAFRAAPADTTADPVALYEKGVAELDHGFKGQGNAAGKHFEQAARHFAAAADAFASRAGKIDPAARALPADFEWSACARCAGAEMGLRAGKLAEARSAVAPFLTDALLARSRYRNLALYEHGQACFLLGDTVAAGGSLNLIGSFGDPAFGTQARYLLARVHEASGERREAVLHYQAVLAGHEELKKKAAELLQQPDRFRDDPAEKARWQALLEQAPPALALAGLRLGVLLYGDGRFEDARSAFNDLLALQPPSPLRPRAQFGLGACLVQLNQFAEALPVLREVADKEPRLAGPALLWLGRAQAGLARSDDPDESRQALKDAVATLRRAAELPADGADPEAKARRGAVLVELAETLQLADQDREAARLFARVAQERLLPHRDEEWLQRQLTALHRAGEYEKSDVLCRQFLRDHPRGALAAEVLFRHAENAHFLLLAAEKDPRRPDRAPEIDRLNEETARRCRAVVDRFPEFEHAPRARQALALTHHRRGEFDTAREVLEGIPAPDRKGDLALVSYLLADCRLRSLPARADDAVAAGRLAEQLKAAVEELTAYAEDPAEPPLIPDALMRLGYCRRRLATLAGEEEEQKQLRERARGCFEQVLLDFPGHELAGNAALERARFLADADAKQGMIRLRRFTAGPLRGSPVAPLAALELGRLLRGEDGKAGEAARVLEQCRQQYEAALLADPSRRDWVGLLLYQQALALKDAGRPSAARALLGRFRQERPGGALAAAAALRWGQCLADEGRQQAEQAEQRLGAAGTPEEKARAEKERDGGRQKVRDAAAHLENEAEKWRPQEAAGDVRASLLYEAAWEYRRLGEQEVEAARVKLQETQPGERPELLRARVPLRPAEKKARALYRRLIDSFPDLALTPHALLELGELHADRGDPAGAGKLFNEAIDMEPPVELTDKLRLRLGASHQARGDGRAALRQYETVARNPDSGLAGTAHLLAGEWMLQAGDATRAVEHFQVFLDQEKFQDQGAATERGLLLLGHVQGRLGRWEAGRKAYETLLAKFAESAWLDDARCGAAWAWLREKRPAEAARALAGSSSPRGQLLLGVCRLEQKQDAEAVEPLLAAASGQAPDDVKALALVEAAHAMAGRGRAEEAARLWRRVIDEHGKSSWAAVARERLKPAAKAAAPHTLPDAVRQLPPALPEPLRLETLGDQQPAQTPADDPLEEASGAALLHRPLPQRDTPAALLRPAATDPFEHREAVRFLLPAEEPPLVRCGPRAPRR
jgi:tetratricopeptide (TPR) repeat protein